MFCMLFSPQTSSWSCLSCLTNILRLIMSLKELFLFLRFHELFSSCCKRPPATRKIKEFFFSYRLFALILFQVIIYCCIIFVFICVCLPCVCVPIRDNKILRKRGKVKVAVRGKSSLTVIIKDGMGAFGEMHLFDRFMFQLNCYLF